MRSLLLFLATLAALGSPPAFASDTKDHLDFYPPFVVEDIARRVQQLQEELGSVQVQTTMAVQYGTRLEWINACAWLQAQTEDVLQFYQPPQDGSEETCYFCGISRILEEASSDSLSDVLALTHELTRQFGGATTRWTFTLRDPERGPSAYLGVVLADASPEACAEAGLPKDCSVEPGAVIVDIIGAPARTAGLKKGDILVRLNEQVVSDAEEAVEMVGNASPGDPFQATVLRGHQEVQVAGVFGGRGDPAR